MPPRLPRTPGEGPRTLEVRVLGAAGPAAATAGPGEGLEAPTAPPARLSRARAALRSAERVAEHLASPPKKRRGRWGESADGEPSGRPAQRERPPKPQPTPVERALKLLSARERTALELDQALARAKVPAAGRAAAVARMRELGYIDDPATAHARARRLLERGESPRLAERRLRAQGVDGPAARAAVAAAAEGSSDDELAARALQARLRGRKVQGPREKLRLLRGLVQKGHRPSAVAKALELEWDGDDGGDADE